MKKSKPITTLSSEQFTDAFLSDVFAKEYKSTTRYCHEAKCWFIWDGTVWHPDISGKVTLLAEACVKNQREKFAEIAESAEVRKTITCLSAGRFHSIVDLAKSKIPIKKSEFNADIWLFNCLNGVIDLRTGKLMPHSPEMLQSFRASVEFDATAKCPEFEKFISQIMLDKPELIQYLQRAAGYSLAGSTVEQCFFLLMGEGRNGKSTLLEILRYIMGDYARTVAAKTLMISNYEQIPSDIALLEGKRFAPCSETSNMQRLNEARIKALTGGDQVEARRRYADEYNYTPQFKLWVATNNEPTIMGTDEGIWRRIHKIPFELKLEPNQVDKQLFDKLKKEASGILNWLIQGCLEWQAISGLNPPEIVRNATQAYREEMDVVREFASDCLIKKQGSTITNQKMYSNFNDWFFQNVGDKNAPSHKEMTQRLKALGYECKRGKVRNWSNVDIVDDTHLPDYTDEQVTAMFSLNDSDDDDLSFLTGTIHSEPART